jgi:hypothetical protein
MPMVWEGVSSIGSNYIWTDGTDIYYSYYGIHYVLNRETNTWKSKTWNGLTDFNGDYIWTDGKNIYLSDDSSKQYVLNGNTWKAKDWNSISFYGHNVWTDGTNIYLSEPNDQYVLKNGAWEAKTWKGFNPIGQYIWTDGTNIYSSDSNNGVSTHYILDKTTSTWTSKTWKGLTNFWGGGVWSDGTNTYYANSYVLKGDTWESVTLGASGAYGWTDGKNLYVSIDGDKQYLFIPTTAKLYIRQNGAWKEATSLGG